jgi:hypothetical protein
VATGLDTSGFIPANELNSSFAIDSVLGAYYGSPPSLVDAMLNRWLATPDRLQLENYTFIDLGSGKGRVVMIASKLPFRRCIGVELNAELHAIATENFARWRHTGHANTALEAVCCDVIDFDFPPGPCLIYMFNPFPSPVIAQLAHRISQAFASCPGQLDLLYVNAEFKHVFDRHPGFTPLWQMPVTMSAGDAAADLLHKTDAAGTLPYSEEGQDPCVAWRFTG